MYSFIKDKHIGIALTPTMVRGVAVGSKGQVKTSWEVPLPEPVFDSVLLKPEVLTQTLHQLVEQAKLTKAYAAVVLPEKYAFSRRHTIPVKRLEEINEAVLWQIESIFPFKKSDIYYDWKLLRFEKNEAEILVTCIAKDLLDGLENSIQAAGLVPISFEPSASALSRVLNSQTQDTYVMLELDAFGSTATLVFKGVSVLTTTTSFSHQTDPATIVANLRSSLMALFQAQPVTETQKVLVYLTGDKATEAMAATLTTHLQMQVTVLPIQVLTPSFHPAYAAATSLALPPEHMLSINLLPTQVRDHYAAQSTLQTTTETLRFVALMAVVMGITVSSILGWTQFEMAKAQANVVAAQQQDSEGTTSQVNLGEIQKISQRLIKLFPLKVSPERFVGEFIKLIPEGITIEEMRYEVKEKTLFVQGIASNREAILQLKQRIDSSSVFNNVTLPLPALESTTDFNFSLAVSVKE